MIFDNKDIIMFSLFSVIIVLIFIKSKTHDHFTVDDTELSLSTQANSDMNTIKTISSFINDNIIATNDTYNMPSFTVDNLYLKKNMELYGISTIKNEINFVTHNQNIILDVFPRYAIIIYHNTNIPNRWVLCDGTSWWVHSTDITIEPVNIRPSYEDLDAYTMINTPDLRGRFIYGSTDIGGFGNFGEIGGSEKITLTEPQLPPHAHPSYMVHNSYSGIFPKKYFDSKFNSSPYAPFSEINLTDINNKPQYALDTSMYGTFAYSDPSIQFEGTLPHNNMPPYITSYYIMKL